MKRLIILISILVCAAAACSASARASHLHPRFIKGGRTAPVGAVTGNAGTAFHVSVRKHGMGALPPKRKVAARVRTVSAILPDSVDLSSYDVPVDDQGAIGSCVAWAIDYAMLGWYSNHDNRPGQPFNPMYTYSQIHLDNSADGGGSSSTDALKVARIQGNDTMAHYSHSTMDFRNRPNASEHANAAGFKIAGWQTLYEGQRGGGGAVGTSIKAALANGKPVAIGLRIRPGFVYMDHSSSAFDDDTTGRVLGGHEVLAIAYDQGGLWFQNSWGTGWGYNGYGRLSWRVVSKDVDEAHTISGLAAQTNDTVPPVMSTPTQTVAYGSVLGNLMGVTVQWSATDPGGVAAYDVRVSTDGQAYAQAAFANSSATRATSATFWLSPGHSYQFAVRAKDRAGNWSGYAVGPRFSDYVYDDSTSSIGWYGSWARSTWSGAYGGRYVWSSTRSSYARFQFTGRGVALAATTSTGSGQANVYVDGALATTIDLYSTSSGGGRIVFTRDWITQATHRIDVQVVGTPGRPFVGVDAFAVLQ